MGTVKEHIKLKDKEKIAYDFYINRGYTSEQALGIVGNLIHESGLNTSIIGDKNLKNNAYGIAQWRMDRYDRLKQRYGNDWNKFENQLEFVDWELNNTHKKAGQLLKSAKTIHEAGQVFSDEFERPKLKYNQDKNRVSKVTSLSKRLIGYEPDINSKQTFLPNTEEISKFVDNRTPSVVLPNYATLPEPIEDKKQEEVQKSPAENKLEEKQNEQNFLNYLQQNKEQLAQQYQTEQEPQKVEAPQLTALDYYNQANQILSAQQGGIITDNRGQWAHPGKITRITSPNITMQNVKYPVIGISEQTKEQKLMLPNLNYFFDNTSSVVEYPILK